MRNFLVVVILVVGGVITFSKCSKKAKYESMVEAGLESGQRHDTLFLGLSLGMSSEDFYKHCWELNKQGIIRQGENNTSVLYEMEDEFKSSVDVNFYPSFYEDKIYEMPVKFNYKAWAPWNKQFSGDSLQLELIDLYKGWYGGGFIEIDHSTRGKAYVKVDGNRRISIYKDISADGTVWALYTDMSVIDEVNELKKKEIEEKE
jgi:hypothetical protein